MAYGGHICWQTGTKFGLAQLDHQENILGKFQKSLTNCIGGDAITIL